MALSTLTPWWLLSIIPSSILGFLPLPPILCNIPWLPIIILLPMIPLLVISWLTTIIPTTPIPIRQVDKLLSKTTIPLLFSCLAHLPESTNIDSTGPPTPYFRTELSGSLVQVRKPLLVTPRTPTRNMSLNSLPPLIQDLVTTQISHQTTEDRSPSATVTTGEPSRSEAALSSLI